MGDGGVACLSSQQHHHHLDIMDKLPDKVIIGSKVAINNGFSANNASADAAATTAVGITTVTAAGVNTAAADSTAARPKVKKVTKVIKKVIKVRKVRKLNSTVTKEKSFNETVNDEVNCAGEKVAEAPDDEVEEGELGTMTWPAKELENGYDEVVAAKEVIVKAEREKDENSVGKSWKGEVKWEEEKVEKGELRPWSESITDRWPKTENNNHRDGNICYNKPCRSMVWRWEPEPSTPPPSSKSLGDDGFQRKELGTCSGWPSKNPYKWEAGQDEKARLSSKILDSENSYWDEYYNGKNPGRDYLPGNREKQHGHDRDNDFSDRIDYATSSKSHRLEEVNQPMHLGRYPERSAERTSRNSSTSKSFSLEKQSS